MPLQPLPGGSTPATQRVTIEEVFDYTGVNLKNRDIWRAQAVLDMFSNRAFDPTRPITDRDLYYLKQAIAYQAAWMNQHPEIFTSMDVMSVDQEGLRVQFRADRESQFLAPLARMAMRRLSFMKSRSIKLYSDLLFPYDNDLYDYEGMWTEMDGGTAAIT